MGRGRRFLKAKYPSRISFSRGKSGWARTGACNKVVAMLTDKQYIFSDKGPPPPGAVVAARRQLEDPNNEAQYGDRIPYIIARGAPHERLVDRAVAPEDFYDRSVGQARHALPVAH